MLYQILALLVVHWVADFVLQTDWQAKNKSKNNEALFRHVLVYTYCLTIAAPFIFSTAPVVTGLLWLFVNSVAHFATDWRTSRWTSKLWSEGRVHDFFVVVGFDQLIHYSTLLLSARWLGLF